MRLAHLIIEPIFLGSVTSSKATKVIFFFFALNLNNLLNFSSKCSISAINP